MGVLGPPFLAGVLRGKELDLTTDHTDFTDESLGELFLIRAIREIRGAFSFFRFLSAGCF
jgi:hypothetical protein